MDINGKRAIKGYKVVLALVLALLFVFLLLFVKENPSEIKLTILQTNDLHGRMAKMPAFARIVKDIRKQEEHVLLLDGGDFFYRGNYEKQGGKAELLIMNTMGYDALVLGNTDFNVRNSKDPKDSNKQIRGIVGYAAFPVLCGNVRYKDTNQLIEGVKEYVILRKNGFRIAIIGVTSTKPADDEKGEVADKVFIDPVEYLKDVTARLEGKADCIIVLAHTGVEVAKKFTGVDVVVCGDDNALTYTPEKTADGAPIIEAGGEETAALGRLDITFYKEDGQWKTGAYTNFIYDNIEGIVPDKKVMRILNELG